LSFEI